MFYVYVLYSAEYNKIYVGFSTDVFARLKSHNHPYNHGWTARYRPWTLIYYEEYQSKKEALSREKQLKSARGRLFIRSTLLK